MCGLGGFSLVEGSTVKSRELANALLTEMEVRGTDASGWAFSTRNGGRGYHKNAVAGSQLSLKGMPRKADTVILHTRAATQGHQSVNENNHPVMSEESRIMLTHNGHISNDFELRTILKDGNKLPAVDSSVAPAMLEQFGAESTDLIAGWAAFAWLDKETGNTLHLARLDTSPVAVARLLDGSIVYASTEKILARALQKVGLRWIGNYPNTFIELDEGDYLMVTDGEVSFGPKLGWYVDYRYSYGTFGISKAATQGGHTASSGVGSSQFANAPYRDEHGFYYEKDSMGFYKAHKVQTDAFGNEGYFDSHGVWRQLEEAQSGFDADGFWGDTVSIAQKALTTGSESVSERYYVTDHDGDYRGFRTVDLLVSYLSWLNTDTPDSADTQWVGSILTTDEKIGWVNTVADVGTIVETDDGDELLSWVSDSSLAEDELDSVDNSSFVIDGVHVLANVMVKR